MAILLALLEGKDDPVRAIVLQFLASYGGLVAGVTFLVSGFKWAAKKLIEGREPIVAIVLTFVVGSLAKLVMPGVYGANTASDWGLHELILLFCAVGAQQLHDKIVNPLLGKFSGGSVPPTHGADGGKGPQGGTP